MLIKENIMEESVAKLIEFVTSSSPRVLEMAKNRIKVRLIKGIIGVVAMVLAIIILTIISYTVICPSFLTSNDSASSLTMCRLVVTCMLDSLPVMYLVCCVYSIIDCLVAPEYIIVEELRYLIFLAGIK